MERKKRSVPLSPEFRMTKKAVIRNLKYLQLVIEGPGSASLASLIAACFSSAVIWGVITIFPTRVPSSRWSRCRAVSLSSDVSISLNLLSLIVKIGYSWALCLSMRGVYTLGYKPQEAIVGPFLLVWCSAQNPQLPRTGVMSPTRIPAHNHYQWGIGRGRDVQGCHCFRSAKALRDIKTLIGDLAFSLSLDLM